MRRRRMIVRRPIRRMYWGWGVGGLILLCLLLFFLARVLRWM